jgi:hypothetical protein
MKLRNLVAVLVMLGACGSTNRHTPDASAAADADAATCTLGNGGDGTRCGDACVDLASDPEHCGTCDEVCQPGSVCQGQCTDVVGSLDGLRWELPCTSGVRADGFSCTSNATFSTSTIVQGASGASYDVQLHFRGIVEQRTYTDATSGGATGSANPEYFVSAAADPATADPYNVYTLATVPEGADSPSQIFRLNSGASDIHRVFLIDYVATVRVATGTTLLLTADSIEGAIVSNTDGNGQPIVVPGVAPDPAPFDGQFVQVDVESVTPTP